MTPKESLRYRGLSLSIFAGAFVFGIVMASLGALLPGLVKKIGFDKAAAGALFLMMNFAMLVGSLVFGPICDRFGFRVMLLLSTSLVGASFLSLASAGSYAVIAGSLVGLGLGGGALNGGTNALLSDISPEQRGAALNRLGIFFGFGALSTPFFIGALRDRLGLEQIIYILGIFSLIPLALYALIRFPAAKHSSGFPRSQFLALLGNPALYLFAFLLFFQSGNEFTVGGWLSTYLPERFGIDAGRASFLLAGYWAAIMVGRSISSVLARKVKPEVMVLGSVLLSLAAVAGLLLAPSQKFAALAVVFIGLGFAAIFPTTLAQAGGTFAELSGTAFSVIFVVALAGGMTCPWLVGKIAQSHTVEAGMGIAIFNCAMIALLQVAIWIRNSWAQQKALGKY